MADFCAKIGVKDTKVIVDENQNCSVCVEDKAWWVLQIGEAASEELPIIESFVRDPLNAGHHLKRDCAYVALRKCDNTLFVVRDPFGFIPIRYSRTAKGWVVWTGPTLPHEVHQRVNYERLAGFVAHRPDRLEEGYFIGVNRVLPGHCMRFTHSSVFKHRYYKPDATYSDKSLDVLCADFLEALFSTIPESANLLALSGGLDSSAILAGMSQCKTYTMFSGQFKSADERREVASLSAFFGVENTLFDVDNNKLWTEVRQFNDSNYKGYGPIFHPPVFGERAFFSSMLKGAEGPIITGIGGDNALDVSPNLVARRLLQTKNMLGVASLWKKYPDVVKHQMFSTPLRRLLPTSVTPSGNIRDDFPWMSYPLKNAEVFSQHWGEARRDRILSWSWEQVTRLLDSHGRSIGRAILSPWMSSAVWNILIKVPPELLFHGDRHKGFLRHAMNGILPENIRTSGKSKHFGKPTESQFLQFQDEIIGLFEGSVLARNKMIEVNRFTQFFEQQIVDIRDNLENDQAAPTMLVWPTIAAEIWLKNN